MEVIDNFWNGTWMLFSDPVSVMYFAVGLFGGMIFGVIPGVSMLTLGAIILPFTGQMRPSDALMLYSVIYCSGVFGGAITSILFNIPGDPQNAPTCFDGYPMTLKGEASRAIGAAVMCSALGGLASAMLMILATPAIANWAVRAFGPPEIFALVLFGMAVSSSVGAKSLWKGWLSVLTGLLLATVGLDPVAGTERFNFGSVYLMAGIGFIPVVLGVFAVSEVFLQAEQRITGPAAMPKVSMAFPSFAEFWRLKIAVVRSMVIGFFAGILPGIGATLAAFLGYNEAVRWSKQPANFGKGELEGVVSSETANNAATGAAMIPLLALGIPGGALTAMMIGVFQLHNMEPGPLVFVNSKDLVWIVFAAMFFANIGILGLGWIQTKTVVHLLRVPFIHLAPSIMVLSMVGAYAGRGLVIDVLVMFASGIVGFFMRRTGYSMAGLVLGLILGTIGEKAFAQSMQIVQYDYLALMQRPIAAVLIVAGLGTIAWNVYKELRGTRHEVREGQAKIVID